MKILLFKGKSFISRAIRFQTRSIYSHVAVELDDSSIIEAWHVGGVVHRKFGEGHSKGTEVDVFKIKLPDSYPSTLIENFLIKQVGKKYDFKSVARFVSRRSVEADDKWFCSELVLAAFNNVHSPLLHINPSTASPRDVAMSPYLFFEGVRYV